MKRYGRAFTQVTRTKDMPVLVMHGEVRKERTCQYGRTVFQGPFCGNLRECIVCQALNNDKGYYSSGGKRQRYSGYGGGQSQGYGGGLSQGWGQSSKAQN